MDKTKSDSLPPLTMDDYTRLHAVIGGVLKSVAMPMSKACIFSSVAGALTIREHFTFDARPVAGAALFGVGGPSPNVLAMCKIEGNQITCDANGFHCWIECEGWAIDLTAPRFGEALGRKDFPERMFQRHLGEMIVPGEEVEEAGDFLLLADQERTNAVVASVMNSPTALDLINVCMKWFRRPPTPIPQQILARGSRGPKPMYLAPARIRDAW